MIAATALALFFLVGQAATKPAATPPTLTETQRQALQIIALRLENAQLKAQAAQADFQRARADLDNLLASLQVEGYTLNLDTLAYIKKEAKR